MRKRISEYMVEEIDCVRIIYMHCWLSALVLIVLVIANGGMPSLRFRLLSASSWLVVQIALLFNNVQYTKICFISNLKLLRVFR